MTVLIGGEKYTYIANAMQDEAVREPYFDLVRRVFRLDFSPWYRSGFSGSRFIPHTLYGGDTALSSVGVVLNDFKWCGSPKRYAQISTVATDPAYRGRGLNKWLMTKALCEWRDKCDCVYLYANDSVVDFYPKFGFVPAHEYRYHLPVTKKTGAFRKLDLSDRQDVDLLVRKHRESNPFSSLTVDNIEIVMFHCVTFLRDNIYYIKQHDAVVIAEFEDDSMFCHDIYSNAACDIENLLGIIASEQTRTVTLGFTPKSAAGCTITKADEANDHFFVLSGRENILKDSRVTFPFLSRA